MVARGALFFGCIKTYAWIMPSPRSTWQRTPNVTRDKPHITASVDPFFDEPISELTGMRPFYTGAGIKAQDQGHGDGSPQGRKSRKAKRPKHAYPERKVTPPVDRTSIKDRPGSAGQA
jgi:hypothetical protein